MRLPFLIILGLSINVLFGFSYLSSAAICIWVWYLLELFEKSNEQIAFKEYILVMNGLHYLFSPAVSYLIHSQNAYRMKLPEWEYFSLAIPCIFLLHLGMNLIPTRIFQFNFKGVGKQFALYKEVLVSWVFIGIGLRLVIPYLPSELSFFVYLLSCIRFVAAFGLFVIDAKKYKWHSLGVLAVELVHSLRDGMFHDTIVWIIFFALFWLYIVKPSRRQKLVLGFAFVFCVYILQISKQAYRTQIGEKRQEAGFSTLQAAMEKNINSNEALFGGSKAISTIDRVNQAWIFASTVNRMNKVHDFQGLTIIKKYAEAAFLPRFLAPNKMTAGDKEIFNKFSGHRVNSGTSMGLGLFADGYIAYGQMGVYTFVFLLGLIFSLIFKAVEGWSRISPFFILLVFPILNYAVRPDCETQTIMGHIVKGLFVFGCLTLYYANYFSRKVHQTRLEEEKARLRNAQLSKRNTLKTFVPYVKAD